MEPVRARLGADHRTTPVIGRRLRTVHVLRKARSFGQDSDVVWIAGERVVEQHFCELAFAG